MFVKKTPLVLNGVSVLFSEQFLQELEKYVERVEDRSSVELVVLASPGSGNYSEIDGYLGFMTSIAFLLIAIYSPWHFSHDILVLWMIVGFGLGCFVSSRLPLLRRPFLSKARLIEQTQRSARDYFVLKGLSHTRERTGLLLYLSYFERRAVLLPDLGIAGKIPGAIFNDLQASWAKAKNPAELESKILSGLETLIEPLSSAMPKPDDDENELPNEICLVEGGYR